MDLEVGETLEEASGDPEVDAGAPSASVGAAGTRYPGGRPGPHYSD